MNDPAIDQPLVTVGMAVFEEERYLRQTVESLLAQDYGNLKLIISDNASTDGTGDICRQFQERDSRVQYFRSQSNVGAVANFNRAFELARGKYFIWAGAHDLWHPTFVSRAVAALEANPRLVLVYPRAMLIDAEGKHQGVMPDDLDTRELAPLARYRKLIWNLQSCNIFHGVIRPEVLCQTGLLRDCWGSDIVLLAELSLQGEFEQLPEVLFYRRDFRQEDNPEQWKARTLKTVEGNRRSKRHEMSLEQLFRGMRNEQLRVIFRSNLSTTEKLTAMVDTIKSARSRFGVRLPADLALRGITAIRSPRTFVKRMSDRLHLGRATSDSR